MVREPPSVEPGSRVCVSVCVRVPFPLTCAVQREPPFHLNTLFILDVLWLHSRRLLAGPQQSKHNQNGAQIVGHSPVWMCPPLSGWFEGSEQLEQKCLPCAECERGIKARVYTTARARRSGLRLRQ